MLDNNLEPWILKHMTNKHVEKQTKLVVVIKKTTSIISIDKKTRLDGTLTISPLLVILECKSHIIRIFQLVETHMLELTEA